MSDLEPHGTLSGVGGALRLGGITSIRECSFVSNMASDSGLAVAAVGSMEINGSSFHRNVFSCDEGEYLEEVRKVCKIAPVPYFFMALTTYPVFCSVVLKL